MNIYIIIHLNIIYLNRYFITLIINECFII
uniref:Uncharacterized protein n=1 Tax=viral metagenome TaxID=1070528 RepID=A0A6C0EVW2_9ZZZZ